MGDASAMADSRVWFKLSLRCWLLAMCAKCMRARVRVFIRLVKHWADFCSVRTGEMSKWPGMIRYCLCGKRKGLENLEHIYKCFFCFGNERAMPTTTYKDWWRRWEMNGCLIMHRMRCASAALPCRHTISSLNCTFIHFQNVRDEIALIMTLCYLNFFQKFVEEFTSFCARALDGYNFAQFFFFG